MTKTSYEFFRVVKSAVVLNVAASARCDGTTQTVPVPDHAEVKIGTLLAIIRQSGVPRGDFEE